MRDVNEQLEILRRGVEKVVPENGVPGEAQAFGPRSEAVPGQVRDRPDRASTSTSATRFRSASFDSFRTWVTPPSSSSATTPRSWATPPAATRPAPQLTEEQVAENAHDYLRQVGKIIDLDRAEVHHNGDWFSKWSFLDVLDLTRQMTLSQISAREDFAKRIAAEKPVYLHECLYPLMQGWDSVEIRADVELGGTEQLFSLLVARDLQMSQGQSPQVALTMPILVGTDGVRRMGKSLGNYIGVADDPNDMFGKVMSIPDEAMRQYFTLLTDIPLAEVDRWLGAGGQPARRQGSAGQDDRGAVLGR